MKVIPYARFSPRPNGEKCESAEEQVEAMQAWAEAGKHEIVAGPFVDRMISGAAAIEDRPGLLDALNAIKRGQMLLVRRLDRLARSVPVYCAIEQELRQRGSAVVSIEGEGTFDEGPTATFVMTVLSAAAQLDREITVHRTKIAMARHQRNGRRMSLKAPIGTMISPEDPKRLKSDAAEALACARIRVLHYQGCSLRGIAKALDEEGFKPRGKKWYHNTIKAVLNRSA